MKPQVILSTSDARGPLGILSELAGAEVCAWAGIATPRTGLVRFPKKPNFDAIEAGLTQLDAGSRSEVIELYKLNRGLLAYCSRHLAGAVDLLSETFRSRARHQEARTSGTALFYVDAYIRNDDRRDENPNAMWYHERIVAIDHAHAFAGLARKGVRGKSLAGQVLLNSKEGFDRHILRSPLGRTPGARNRIRQVAAKLQAVPDKDIERLLTIWPRELDHDTMGIQRERRQDLVDFLRHRREYAITIGEQLIPLLRGRPHG